MAQSNSPDAVSRFLELRGPAVLKALLAGKRITNKAVAAANRDGAFANEVGAALKTGRASNGLRRAFAEKLELPLVEVNRYLDDPGAAPSSDSVRNWLGLGGGEGEFAGVGAGGDSGRNRQQVAQ